jgi:hypothetical protein
VELSACAGGQHDDRERCDPRSEQLELRHDASLACDVRPLTA